MVLMSVWPTDGADGSVATEARWRKMGRLWAASAVAAGQGGEMAPSLAYPNLTVQSGSCWVDGHYCELAGSQVLTVTANGLAVVRFDPAANTAELLYRDGVTVPAQNPTGTWELPIAQIVGSALTDRRALVDGATGTVRYFDMAYGTFESADIGTTPTVIRSVSVPVIAGHVYGINTYLTLIGRVGTTPWGGFTQIKTDATIIATRDVYLPFGSVAASADSYIQWKATASTSVVFAFQLTRSSYTVNGIRYTSTAGFPTGIVIVDLGPTIYSAT